MNQYPQQYPPAAQPPPDVAQHAAYRGLGGYEREFAVPGPLAGVLIGIGGVVLPVAVEAALIYFTDHYLVGGCLCFVAVGAVAFMINTFVKAGTKVHLFAYGVVASKGSNHQPVRWDEVGRLRVTGKNGDGDHILVRRDGSEVKLTSDLIDEKELFARLRDVAARAGWQVTS
ncbi:MAG TPA: hypothetical protein VGN37_18455 [Actinocatenispora sp.]